MKEREENSTNGLEEQIADAAHAAADLQKVYVTGHWTCGSPNVFQQIGGPGMRMHSALDLRSI